MNFSAANLPERIFAGQTGQAVRGNSSNRKSPKAHSLGLSCFQRPKEERLVISDPRRAIDSLFKPTPKKC